MTPILLHPRYERVRALLGLLLTLLGGSHAFGNTLREHAPASPARGPIRMDASIQAAVPAPTRVIATPLDSRRARVSWKNPAGRIEAIQIYQRVHPRTDFSFGENVPPMLESAVLDGLPAGAVVDFAVRVQVGGRWSELSSHATVDLPDPEPDPEPEPILAPPASVRAVALSPTSARIDWSSSPGTVNGYELWQRLPGQDGHHYIERITVPRTYTVREGLPEGAEVGFAIRARRGEIFTQLELAMTTVQLP